LNGISASCDPGTAQIVMGWINVRGALTETDTQNQPEALLPVLQYAGGKTPNHSRWSGNSVDQRSGMGDLHVMILVKRGTLRGSQQEKTGRFRTTMENWAGLVGAFKGLGEGPLLSWQVSKKRGKNKIWPPAGKFAMRFH